MLFFFLILYFCGNLWSSLLCSVLDRCPFCLSLRNVLEECCEPGRVSLISRKGWIYFVIWGRDQILFPIWVTNWRERFFWGKRVKGRSDLRINQECRGKTASKPDSILSIIQRIKKFEVNVHWREECQQQNPNPAQLLTNLVNIPQ